MSGQRLLVIIYILCETFIIFRGVSIYLQINPRNFKRLEAVWWKGGVKVVFCSSGFYSRRKVSKVKEARRKGHKRVTRLLKSKLTGQMLILFGL